MLFFHPAVEQVSPLKAFSTGLSDIEIMAIENAADKAKRAEEFAADKARASLRGGLLSSSFLLSVFFLFLFLFVFVFLARPPEWGVAGD